MLTVTRNVSGPSTHEQPFIRIAGEWLLAAGFHIGDKVSIGVEHGKLTICTLPEIISPYQGCDLVRNFSVTEDHKFYPTPADHPVAPSQEKKLRSIQKLLDLKHPQNEENDNIFLLQCIIEQFKNAGLAKKEQEAVDGQDCQPVTSDYSRSENERRQARNKYFPAISAALKGYAEEAEELEDVMRYMVGSSLNNTYGFGLAYEKYNSACNNLYVNSDAFGKAIADNWDNFVLPDLFYEVSDFAINYIHRCSILTMDDVFNKKINDYFKCRRKSLKYEILRQLKSLTDVLDNCIPILKRKMRPLLSELRSGNRPVRRDPNIRIVEVMA